MILSVETAAAATNLSASISASLERGPSGKLNQCWPASSLRFIETIVAALGSRWQNYSYSRDPKPLWSVHTHIATTCSFGWS